MKIFKKNSIIKIESKIPWKITVIMAWVHGNEKSWIIAIQKLIPLIKIETWTVYFIFANLKAIEQNIRFVEKNLNRCFKKRIIWTSYEDKRAKEIRKILKKSDYLLDIHNTNNTQSEPFIISEEKDIGKYFPVKKIITWLNVIHAGGSDGYLWSLNKVWVCIECGSISDPKWALLAENAIINFLKYTWNISGKPNIFKNKIHIDCNYMYISKTNTFTLSKKFKDFEKIKKWQPLWYDWNTPVLSDRNWCILFSKNTDKIWMEAFVLGQ